MRPRRALAIVAFVAALAPTARGEDAREASRAAFRRGVAAAEHGRYDVARDAFAEAYRLFPHPSILLNLGIAHWKTGDLVDAEQELAKFLADDGGASQEEIASARAALASSRDHVGTLRVSVTPATARATIDGKPIALVVGGANDVRLGEGDHRVAFEAEGYEARADVVRVAAKRVAPLTVALVPATSSGGSAPIEAPAGERVDRSPRDRLGWILVGAGTLCAAGGAVTGARALYLSSAYGDPANARYQQPDTKSAGVAFRTAADVLFGAAIVTGGVGAWLLLTSSDGGGNASKASLVVGPSFAGVRGAF